MTPKIRSSIACLAVSTALSLSSPAWAGPPGGLRCKHIHADLVEVGATEGCNPGLASCFLGEVAGNHGLDGTTHFHSDTAAAGPSTSPGFISYGGAF